MTEQKRDRGIKVLVTRKIRLSEDVNGKANYVKKGAVITMSATDVKSFGNAVTRDLPEIEE